MLRAPLSNKSHGLIKSLHPACHYNPTNFSSAASPQKLSAWPHLNHFLGKTAPSSRDEGSTPNPSHNPLPMRSRYVGTPPTTHGIERPSTAVTIPAIRAFHFAPPRDAPVRGTRPAAATKRKCYCNIARHHPHAQRLVRRRSRTRSCLIGDV